MNDMTDLLAELDGVANILHMLSIVTGIECANAVGEPMPETIQSALFSVARQTERITGDLYSLDHELAKEAKQ